MTADTDNMIFRSVYVDPDVDKALRQHADQVGITKAEMFRRYLQRGMDDYRGGIRRSLSGILCARHSMTIRSMYAKQNEDEECGDCRKDSGAAVDTQGTH